MSFPIARKSPVIYDPHVYIVMFPWSLLTEVELVKRFSQSSPSSAARGPPKRRDKATALASTLASLWRYLLIMCVFTVQKMAVHKKRCLKFVVVLLPVVLGSDIGICSRNKDAAPHPGLSTPQRNMKVTVLSMALLFTILLCTAADAEPVSEESGDCDLQVEHKVEEQQKPEIPLKLLLRLKRLAVGLHA
ncbi:uncharacterized protein AAGF69_012924 [Amazona ochrocephala]